MIDKIYAVYYLRAEKLQAGERESCVYTSESSERIGVRAKKK